MQPTPPDLLPCPFCGGAPQLVQFEAPTEWTIECEDCAATGGFVDQLTPGRLQAMATAWNTRVPSPVAKGAA